MRIIVAILGVIIFTAGLYCPAFPHSVHYQVENKGISVRVFYAEDDPASYSSYEIFGPGDTIPHQKGRTDKNGFASFLPDRPGTWVINVSGESEHGMHGIRITVEVNENMYMESFKKPLVAQYTGVFVGISIILFLFSLWVLLRRRRKTDGKALPRSE